MKMVKSLLLGTAAGLVAMSGAMASDFPDKAKPVQYVKVVSLMYTPAANTMVVGANGYFNDIAALKNVATFDQPYKSAKFEQAMKFGYIDAQAALIGMTSSGATVNGKAKTWQSAGYGGASFTPPSALGQKSAAQAFAKAHISAVANTITTGRFTG